MDKRGIIFYILLIVFLTNQVYSQPATLNRVDTTIVIQLYDKWNSVSLPVSVTDKRVSSNFPAQDAWAFPNTAETPAYYKTDTMENGQGYWIKVNGSQTVQITGSIILEDTIEVKKGWNLIGSIIISCMAFASGSFLLANVVLFIFTGTWNIPAESVGVLAIVFGIYMFKEFDRFLTTTIN